MTLEENTPKDAKRTGLDRRSILKGAAWTAPVVAIAVATPLAAASGEMTCEVRYEVVDPTTTTVEQWKNDIAKIEFSISKDGTGFVRITYVKDYASSTALNVNHEIVQKWDGGVKAGFSYMYPFTSPPGTCFNPSIIQVDGQNSAHWYSHVNGGKGGFQ